MNKIRSKFTDIPRDAKTIPGDSLTQQHFKDDADINIMTKKYLRGQTPTLGNPMATRQPIFGDFTSIDFMDMKNAIIDAEQQFASLPSKIRNRFKNDPYSLIRWVEKPENREEAIKLGLLPNQVNFIDDIEQLRAEEQKRNAPFGRDADGKPLPMSAEKMAEKQASKEGHQGGLPNGDK